MEYSKNLEEKICDGVHIIAIGREEAVPKILGASGIAQDLIILNDQAMIRF